MRSYLIFVTLFRVRSDLIVLSGCSHIALRVCKYETRITWPSVLCKFLGGDSSAFNRQTRMDKLLSQLARGAGGQKGDGGGCSGRLLAHSCQHQGIHSGERTTFWSFTDQSTRKFRNLQFMIMICNS